MGCLSATAPGCHHQRSFERSDGATCIREAIGRQHLNLPEGIGTVSGGAPGRSRGGRQYPS
jgi:hypothetical protein